MNLFDKAFQFLGFPAADFTDTVHTPEGDGVKCVSTLVYDNIEHLHPTDWVNAFEKAVQMVNHELNKMIDKFSIKTDTLNDSISLTIEVLR